MIATTETIFYLNNIDPPADLPSVRLKITSRGIFRNQIIPKEGDDELKFAFPLRRVDEEGGEGRLRWRSVDEGKDSRAIVAQQHVESSIHLEIEDESSADGILSDEQFPDRLEGAQSDRSADITENRNYDRITSIRI